MQSFFSVSSSIFTSAWRVKNSLILLLENENCFFKLPHKNCTFNAGIQRARFDTILAAKWSSNGGRLEAVVSK